MQWKTTFSGHSCSCLPKQGKALPWASHGTVFLLACHQIGQHVTHGTEIPDQREQLHGKVMQHKKVQKSNPTKSISKNKLITSWQHHINSAIKLRERHTWLYISSRITHESRILFFIPICASQSHEVLRWDSVLWTWVHECTKKWFSKIA